MSPYSGMVDLAEKKGLLKKDGNRLMYVTLDGEIIKQFRKAWESNEEEKHVSMIEKKIAELYK